MTDSNHQSSSSLWKIPIILVGIFLLFVISDHWLEPPQKFIPSILPFLSGTTEYGSELTDTEIDPGMKRFLSRVHRLSGNFSQNEANNDATISYNKQVEDFRKDFNTSPDSVLKIAERVLESNAVSDFEKYLTVHILTRLPIEQTEELLKTEIERPLPVSGTGNEDGLAVIESMARKLAAIEAIANSDRDYLLDLIENPETRSAVRRAAVIAYINSDSAPAEAVLEIEPLLKKNDAYMLQEFLYPKSQEAVRLEFLPNEKMISKRNRQKTGNPTLDLAREFSEDRK